MYPAGGDGVDEGGMSGQKDVAPADWRKLQPPSLQQQPEDLVKVPLPEFLEVPWKNTGKNNANI